MDEGVGALFETQWTDNHAVSGPHRSYGPDETWDRVVEAIEAGDDIGHALWEPDHLRGS